MPSYNHITLNELISELTKLQEKHGNDQILSIGAASGKFKGLTSPFSLQFEGDVFEYIPACQHDLKPEHSTIGTEKYRVVLTCWDYGKPQPYIESMYVLYDSLAKAQASISKRVSYELEVLNEGRSREPILDSDGTVVGNDFPFRSDEDGDHENTIRFWDGDDYFTLTHFDVHPVKVFHSMAPSTGPTFSYRGFEIRANNSGTRFPIYEGDARLAWKGSLQAALTWVDEHLLSKEYSCEKDRKPHLSDQIRVASSRTAEARASEAAKRIDPEREI